MEISCLITPTTPSQVPGGNSSQEGERPREELLQVLHKNNDVRDTPFLSELQRFFSFSVKLNAGDIQACPGYRAVFPRGLHRNWTEGGRKRERGREGGREVSGIEYKNDRCPGVKGDTLPTQ